MNHTEAITVLRDKLRDQPAAVAQRQWSDATLARYIDSQQKSIFRDLAKASEGYYNERLHLCEADAEQIHTGQFQYELPPWVFNIVEQGVRLKADSEAVEGRKIYPADDVDMKRTPSWRFDGTHTLMLYDTAAQDLTVEVAKVPAPPIAGTMDIASGADSSHLTCVADAAATFDHDLVKDAYLGTIIEITAAVTNTDIIGEQRRVLKSEVKTVAAGVRRLVLTLSKPFSNDLLVGHGYVSLVDAGSSAHQEYMLLQTKLTALSDTDNPVPESMVEALRVETARFLGSLKRRENVGARELGGSERGFGNYDPDRDPEYHYH